MDKSQTVSSSSCLKLRSSVHGVQTLYNCSIFLLVNATISLRISHDLQHRDTKRQFCVNFLPPWQLFSCSSRNSSRFRQVLVPADYIPNYTWSNMISVPKINSFLNSITWEPYSAFSQTFLCHPRSQIRRIFVSYGRTDITICVFS